MTIATPKEKPETLSDFLKWGSATKTFELNVKHRSRYGSVVLNIKSQLEKSEFWANCLHAVRLEGTEYYQRTTYPLFPSEEASAGILEVKTVKSAIEKCFRKDSLDNEVWPSPPANGWITPQNWFVELPDNVRTQFFVKYLDGVEAIVNRLEDYFRDTSTEFETKYQAKENGYYGAHIVFKKEFEVPGELWTTETILAPVEIQIHTQLQEIISRLTHEYYESRRLKSAEESHNWQWDYKGEAFSPNYLGHILHYIEGMIMEIRSRNQGKK